MQTSPDSSHFVIPSVVVEVKVGAFSTGTSWIGSYAHAWSVLVICNRTLNGNTWIHLLGFQVSFPLSWL